MPNYYGWYICYPTGLDKAPLTIDDSMLYIDHSAKIAYITLPRRARKFKGTIDLPTYISRVEIQFNGETLYYQRRPTWDTKKGKYED